MKRKAAILLILALMLQSFFCGNILAADDGINDTAVQAYVSELRPDKILVETENKINTDFSKNVPKELKGKTVRVDGESVWRLDGKNAVVGGEHCGSISGNTYISADVKLVKSTGVGSGAFSLASTADTQSSITVRFAYVSAIKYNPETRMGDGTEIIRDRIAIVRTSSYGVERWIYGAISDHELGVQNNSSMTTPWIRLKALSVDGMYYLSAYSAEGELLDSLSISHKDLLGESTGAALTQGGFQVTSNSCEVLVDNLSCGEIKAIDEPKLAFDTKSAAIDTPVGIKLVSADGKELATDGMQMTFDSSTKRQKDGKFVFSSVGRHSVKLGMFDIGSEKNLEYTAEIDVKNKINYSALKIEKDKEKLYRNEEMTIGVKGIDENGDSFDISPADYKIEEPVTHGENTVSFENSGKGQIKVKSEGLEGTAEVYVSKYEALTPAVSSETIEQGAAVEYSLTKRMNSMDYVMNGDEFSVTADREGLEITNGVITAVKTGEYVLSFETDGMTEKKKITVIERRQGKIIDENFENESQNEYFMYPKDHIVSDNGNRVLHLANEETEKFGGMWKRYKITARVKIVTPVLDEKCEYATFEIKPQTREPADKTVLGGTGGIPCIYRINHKIDSGAHMRISAVAGENINIEDGEYHNFSVEVYGPQVIFEIDGIRQYYNLSANDSGYFTFMANNCEVYIDDVSVEKNVAKWSEEIVGISADEDIVEANPFEPWQFKALNAFRANFADGSYAYPINWGTSYSYSEDNRGVLEYEQIDGFEYGDVLRKNTIVFKRNVPDGAEITVKAKYKGYECVFKVKAKRPQQSYEEYVKNRVDIHRENYAFRLIRGYNSGIANTPSSRGTLPHRMAVMTIYPKVRDYSKMFEWYEKSTDYEERFIGRGNDAGDFILLQGMATYIRLKDIANVSDEAWEGWRKYINTYKWAYPDDYLSENHKMIFFLGAILAGETWPEDTMYNGLSGRATAEEHTQYLIDWYNHRLERGMQEYDSPNYYNVDLFAGEMFYSSVKNEKLKKLASDFLTLIYADSVTDMLEDNLTGAHLRTYHEVENLFKLKSLGFCFNTSTYMTDEFYQMNVQDGEYAFTDYMPPDEIFDIALDEGRYIENRERHSVYTLMDDKMVEESERKYTYRTPEYSVGSLIYRENLDKYGVGVDLFADNGVYNKRTPVLAGFQGIQWSINLGKGTSSIITENHPSSGQDFYGDTQCQCGMYFQNLGASVGMHRITVEKHKKCTHFYIPKAKLQTVQEENGWIFAQHFGVFAAVKPLRDGQTSGTLYEWGDPNVQYSGLKRSECEVLINSANTAFVSEVTSEKDFGGSFEEFKSKVLENEKNIVYSANNDEYFIEYTSLDGSVLKLDYKNNQRYLDGRLIDFTDSKMFDSKYVKADWEAGEVTISGKNGSIKLDKYKQTMGVATAKSLIDKVNGLVQKLKYENKFGRGIEAIAANMPEINECVEGASKYEDSYARNVLLSGMKELAKQVDKIFDSASDRERESIRELKEKLDSCVGMTENTTQGGVYVDDKKNDEKDNSHSCGCDCFYCRQCIYRNSISGSNAD